MSKLLNFFTIFNLRSWKQNKLQLFLSIFGISMGIAISLAIQVISIYNNFSIEANANKINGGDISIALQGDLLNSKQINYLNQEKKSNKLTYTKSTWCKTNINFNNRSSILVLRFIDTGEYPLYKDSTLKVKLLDEPQNIIISSNLAARLSVRKGDSVNILNSLSGEKETYKVADVAEPDGENGQDMNIFGYAFINQTNLTRFVKTTDYVSKVYINTVKKADISETKNALVKLFPYADIKSKDDVLNEAKNEIELTKKGLNVIGIITFILGGIGIANIMVLSIMRRQKELCILSVIGMKKKHMRFFLMLESILISLLSSIIGIPLGIIFGSIINYVIYGEGINLSVINYIFAPVCSTVLLSILVSLSFVLIPLAIFKKIKPVAILREQYVSAVERTGIVKPILAITFIFGIVFTFYSGTVSGLFYSIGLLLLGLLIYGLVTLFLTIVSKIRLIKSKSMFFVTKNIGRQKRSKAIVMLTLIVGIVSMGVTINISNSILPSLKKTVENQLGYNLLISTSTKTGMNLERDLKAFDGINGFSKSLKIDTLIKTVNSKDVELQYKDQVLKGKYGSQIKDLTIEGVSINAETSKQSPVSEGRTLASEDIGKSNAVINTELADSMGIKINDEVGFLLNNEIIKFKVVGIKKKTLINTSQLQVSLETLKNVSNWNSILFYVNADNKKLPGIISTLYKKNDNIFALNINDLLPSINKTLNNQIVIFTFISIFSILAALFLMSNITLMSVLERLKEFVLLKTLGAKTKNILKYLFVESILIGIVGSIIAIFISESLTNLFIKMTLKIEYSSRIATVLELIGLTLAVVILGTILIIPKVKIKNLYTLLRAE